VAKQEGDREDLAQALAGDEGALARLVRRLTPVIQARVARCLLLRQARGPGRSVRQEVEDLTQEVFLQLFADGARVLRSWQPERGLALDSFAGLVAERLTVSILRSGKKSPWKEDPTLTEELDSASPAADPERQSASREELRRLLGRLDEELSPLGRTLFELLFVEELAPPEVMARTGLSADAVYAWRSRLRKLAGRLLAEISEIGPSMRRSS
jgi:RNA polymerase sigma factor (sigma-70 family)